MKKWIRIAAATLLVLIIGLAAAIGLKKAHSMYWNLSGKVDYMNNLVYSMNTRMKEVENTLGNIYEHYKFDYSWAEDRHLIAHAFGGVNGAVYTNSLEAFEANYALGHRVFEVDFDLTQPEQTLVATHDDEQWNKRTVNDPSVPFTYENFMNSKMDGQYTVLDYEDIINLMIQYPDIYIVTDTKYVDSPSIYLQFAQLIRCALFKDDTVLSRIIPQIYHTDMLGQIMQMYPFESVILTLYATVMTPQEVADFCRETGVGFVTAPMYGINQETLDLWNEQGLIVASHTSNDREETQELFSMGLDMMYTDFLTEEDF
ncbi:MAG: hypothetical protein IJ418_09590 [Clostridia bacterium]|nr:hypothetical protein [Clostridia bacterium]